MPFDETTDAATRLRVDVHAHYTPPGYVNSLRDAGAVEELSVFRALPQLTHAAGPQEPGIDAAELERRISELDAAGVDVQIISIGALQPYLREAETAARLARQVNDAYAEYVRQAPTRLQAFAALPLPHAAESVAEAARVLDMPEFVGVALGPSAGGRPLDDPSLRPLWEELDRRAAVVYLHPGVEIAGVVGCCEFHLAPDLVSPSELAVAATRLVLTGILDDFPSVRFVLATLGGALPFLARRLDVGLSQGAPERHAELGGIARQLRRFWVDTSVNEEPDALLAAAKTFGADRILLGSDYPRPGNTPSTAVAYVQQAPGLTAEARAAIIDANVLDLFPTTPALQPSLTI